VRFEVLMAVTVKITVCWVVTPCGLVKALWRICRILPWWWTYYVLVCAGWNFRISWFVLGPLNL